MPCKHVVSVAPVPGGRGGSVRQSGEFGAQAVQAVQAGGGGIVLGGGGGGLDAVALEVAARDGGDVGVGGQVGEGAAALLGGRS
ncbi:hypothetical protein GCM10010198_55490 [Nocardia seriolae]|nr:hypothetical protein NSERKGN1266_47620 [Nocardia seriolae]GEM23460.1 hypothetical protein NS2_16990 [Nocardia seriolae NBRC 15557]